MRLQSTAALRAQFNKTPAGPSTKELLLTQQHKRAHAVIERLRSEWDGTTIVVPLSVRMLNGSMAAIHWATKAEIKQQYASHLDLLVMAKLMPPPPAVVPVPWRVAVTFYGAGAVDIDNSMACLKWPLDWLVAHKYAAGDSEDCLEIVSFKREVDRRCPRLEFRQST